MKKLCAVTLAALLCLTLAACGSGEPTEETDDGPSVETPAGSVEVPEGEAILQFNRYTSESGAYSIAVPDIDGGWTVFPGDNEDHLILDNAGQTLSVLVQGIPKNREVNELSALTYLYRTQMAEMYGEPTAVEVKAPAVKAAEADAYTMEEEGIREKALIAYLETEENLYVYSIIGEADLYDANIEGLLADLAFFQEN